MRILGIETSCDETGVAIYDEDHGLLANQLYSQIKTHVSYGGVVPELASRDHLRKTLHLIDLAMKEACCLPAAIDGIAYTAGPGLVGALLVGASVACSLAYAWGKPAIAVNHMEGHLLAPMLEKKIPSFPFVALLVSGGHTQLVQVAGIGQYQLLGESVDDAAGEAFDKTAKLLGLAYPGGPLLAKLANKGRSGVYCFPRPMTNRPGLDFSFSGLKTFAANSINACQELNEQARADIAYAFQQALVETLVIKCRRALQQTQMTTLVVAGGVGANERLRHQLTQLMINRKGHIYCPSIVFCTDNGAMIAYAGAQRFKLGQQQALSITAYPSWSIEDC